MTSSVMSASPFLHTHRTSKCMNHGYTIPLQGLIIQVHRRRELIAKIFYLIPAGHYGDIFMLQPAQGHRLSETSLVHQGHLTHTTSTVNHKIERTLPAAEPKGTGRSSCIGAHASLCTHTRTRIVGCHLSGYLRPHLGTCLILSLIHISEPTRPY